MGAIPLRFRFLGGGGAATSVTKRDRFAVVKCNSLYAANAAAELQPSPGGSGRQRGQLALDETLGAPERTPQAPRVAVVQLLV